MDRVIDSISDRALHKLLLVEQAGTDYAVVHQAANRQTTPLVEHMTEAAAFAYWRKACIGMYYAVTHNLKDAWAMADRRIDSIH